jgi:hypothetical protein
MAEPIVFHGQQVPSLRTVARELAELGCSPANENRRYKGWDYSTLGSLFASHLASLDPMEYEAQYSEACELCQHYVGQTQLDKDAGQKARIVLENVIHPCFRATASAPALRKACQCYASLNSTQWFVADKLAELLVKQTDSIIHKDLLSLSYIVGLVEDWAYSDDKRKRLHAISIIRSYYSVSPSKASMEKTLDVLSQSDKTSVQATKALDDLGVTERRERRRRRIRLVEVVGIILVLLCQSSPFGCNLEL